MERFFFHVAYGETSLDNEGVLLPSLGAARAAAVTLVGDMLRDEGDRFWIKPDLTVTVADSEARTLWTLSVTGQAAGATATG